MFVTFTSCAQDQGVTVTVEAGIEIPIKACVEANSKILGNSVDPVAFCKCVLPKFYKDFKDDPAKLKLLNEGNFSEISITDKEILATYFQNCISASATNDSTAKLTITPRMRVKMFADMKKEVMQTDLKNTQDVDVYCNCILDGMQTDFTIREIMQEGFKESEKSQALANKCILISKRK
jgi:hypothetical protein